MRFSLKLFIPTCLLTLSFIFDRQIAILISKHRIESLTSLVFPFKELWPAYLFFVILSIYFLFKREERWLPVIWLSTTSASLISEMLKILVSRPRPYEVLSIKPLATHYAFSFPSGHMTLLFSIVALLWIPSLSQYKKVKLMKYIWLIYALIVGFNRLYLNVHYLSDILAGVFLGYTVGYLWVMMQNNHTLEKNLFKKWWWLLALLIFLARTTLISLTYK